MPNPSKYKTRKDFMKACVPMVIEEGTAKDGKQGFAICTSMWNNRHKKSKGQEILEQVAKDLNK